MTLGTQVESEMEIRVRDDVVSSLSHRGDGESLRQALTKMEM